MLWTIFTAILAILIYEFLLNTVWYWRRKGIVHATALPFVGNLLSMVLRRKPFLDFVYDMYNRFPNERYNGMQQFNKPMLQIRDLDLIKQITVKEFDHFMDHGNSFFDNGDPLLSKNLAGLKGQKWREMRATLSPSFTSSKMKAMYILLTDCAEQFVDYFSKLSQNEGIIEHDVKDPFTRFTNDAIASVAFGLKCDSLSERENQFYMMTKKATNIESSLMLFLVVIFPALSKLLNIRIIEPEVQQFFHKIVKDTIELREKQNITRPDMIQLLMDARVGKLKHEENVSGPEIPDTGFATIDTDSNNHENNQKLVKTSLTIEEIVAQAFIFVFGGFDTSSTLMCFIAYELAMNPQVQKKLQEEIDAVMKRENGKISYDVLMKMKYLDMVVSETLRLWPPGFQLDRLCIKDFVVAPEKPHENPFVIEKGTTCIIPVYGIHMDPDFFPDPKQFDPERFEDENKHRIVPGSYMPFGAGPRSCIASRFALLENKTLFAYLLAKFDIIRIDRTPVPLVMGTKKVNLGPENGFWLGFRKRKMAN